MFYFLKSGFEELLHQSHLYPQHSLFGPPQVPRPELIDCLSNLELTMRSYNIIDQTYIVANVPPVEVNEGEGEGDVKGGHLVRVCTSLAGLEGDHEVDVAGRALLLVAAHKILPKDCAQQTLKCLVHT